MRPTYTRKHTPPHPPQPQPHAHLYQRYELGATPTTLHTEASKFANPLEVALVSVLLLPVGPEHGPQPADWRQLYPGVGVVLRPALRHLFLLGLAHHVHGQGALQALRGEGRHARVDGLAGRGVTAGVAAPGGARAELQRVDGAFDVGDLGTVTFDQNIALLYGLNFDNMYL